MERAVLIAVLALAAIQCYGAVQVQMPIASELQLEDNNDLQAQIKDLQRNVSDIWTYIYELRSAVSQHLTHLRQHQVEMESTIHRMEHLHEDSHTHGNLHGDSHHHGGDEKHSHSGEQHSHGDHGSDHHHSHSGEQHSHSGEQHSHSGEHHSHSGEVHSHSGEHHSHSGEHGHHSHSYSHSHSHGGHDHSKEDSHSHGAGDHKDSHETEDLTQSVQQVQQPPAVPPVAEPVVSATNRREHYHHHHHESRTESSSGMNLMGESGFHSHHHHNHHHHDSTTTTTSSSSNRNRTVELPRYSDYDQYDFAICNVQPNRAISADLQQNVGGTVTLWQKKTEGPLNFHVRLQGFDVGNHHGHHGAHQAIQQEEDNETPQEVGHRHGFHIHTSGDLSNGCQSTGGHFNPKGVNHGGPDSQIRHVGDLGNIECDANGVTNILFSDGLTSLRGQYSVIGKAIVIHAKEDDLGLGGDEESLKTGNAGTRIACCVIQKVDKLPIRYYKSMKSATQYKN